MRDRRAEAAAVVITRLRLRRNWPLQLIRRDRELADIRDGECAARRLVGARRQRELLHGTTVQRDLIERASRERSNEHGLAIARDREPAWFGREPRTPALAAARDVERDQRAIRDRGDEQRLAI